MGEFPPLYIVIPRYGADLGGVTSHVETLIRQLRARGHQVTHWAGSKTGTLEKAVLFAASGFDAAGARQANIRRRQGQILRWLEGVEVPAGHRGVVHTHDAFAAQVAVQHGGLPVVHTVHGPASREVVMDFGDRKTGDYIRRIEADAYHNVQGIISVDEGQAEILEQDFAISRPSITVIRNAVDNDAVIREAEAQSDHPLCRELTEVRRQGSRVVLIPRRLVEKNGVHQAVKSLPLLPEKYVFWVAGDGPMAEAVRGYLAGNSLTDRVRLLGGQSHPTTLGLMLQANVVLIPSIPAHGVVEATSIAALEAMALGKPVVASSVGGLAEMIRDGETGLLYNPESAEALGRAITGLEDERLSVRLGQNARRYVQHEWSVERWADAIILEYRKVLA